MRRTIVLALLLVAQVVPAAAAVDPFYLGIFAEGVQAFERRDYPSAARNLRLACFGMLDEPTTLAGCLARLAVAEAEAGDFDAFRETFLRLAQAEDRFGAYTKATLPTPVRKAFEQQAGARVADEVLAASPAFARLRTQKEVARIEALPPKARREELERRIAAEPRNPAWKVLLARLEIVDGRPANALSLAQAALALAPDDAGALCVRGLARARGGACTEALPDLAGCAETTQFATPAAARLSCLIAAGAGDEARAFVAALPPALREEREIARLSRQIPAVANTSGTPPRSGASTPLDPPTGGGGVPSAGEAVARSARDTAALEQARALLTPEASARDLKRARDLAKGVADARPADREAQLLAAEAAYRNSRWQEAAAYFKRGGDPGDGHPEQLFYLAVSLFESGDQAGAAVALRRALPNLQASPFIDEYTKKILSEPIR